MPYNENFIDSFLKAAALKLAQVPQQLAQANIDPLQLQSTVSKLIQNLKQSYSPISVEGNDKIFQKNIFSLNAFLVWLVDSKVKFNGHRIAYNKPPAPVPGSPSAQKGTIPGINKEEADKQMEYVGDNIVVWKEGLTEFLKDLRKQAADSNNLYFKELVSKLIEDTNTSKVFDTALETEEEKKEQLKEQNNLTQPKQYQQQKSQEAYQDVSVKSIQTTLQQSGQSSQLVLPFDLVTDMISIARFRRFLMQISALVDNPTFNAEMRTYVDILESEAYTLDGGLRNYQQQAANTAAAMGGFSLNVNMSTEQFVNTFANGDYAKARNLLLVLTPICTQLSGILRILEASPTISELVGNDILREQTQRGQDYSNRINSFISQIDNLVGKK